MGHLVQITFGMTFDRGVWPGPIADRDHAVGEPWVGPIGLLSLLETQLGLTRPSCSLTIRAASLVPVLRSTDGFWRRSVEVDPLEVAHTLLSWRDTLGWHGWRGEPTGATRLDQLASVTSEVQPGGPDRLAMVIDALRDQPIDIDCVRVLGEKRTALPRMWRDAIDALESRGVTITQTPVDRAAGATGDLSACLDAGFDPVGDGSLQLLRPVGPMTAAEQVAAWLAERGHFERAVVIGSDVTLDDALRRHGIATLGASKEPAGSLMQLLPLVLELTWSPQDPRHAKELLNLRHSPVPSGIVWKLDKALGDWPALDSDSWRKAIEEGLETIEDERRRASVKDRLTALLTPLGDGVSVDAGQLRRRIETLRTWLQGRLGTADADQHQWGGAVLQCSNLLVLLEVSGGSSITRPHLRRLLQAATLDAGIAPRHPHQAGMTRVSRPASVVGAVDTIIWWDFTRAAVESVRQLPLAGDETDALGRLGVVLPEPTRLAEELCVGWKRPFEQATGTLLLVCPRVAPDGRDAHAHPVFDEVSAQLKPQQVARLERTEPLGVRRTRGLSLLTSPLPQRTWRVDGNLLDRAGDGIAPTAAGELLGCPLHWVMKRMGVLYRGRSEALPTGALLAGNLSHDIIERVLRRLQDGETLTAEQAGELAGQLFDNEGPRLAHEYFAHGSEAVRAEMRHVIVNATHELVGHILESGAEIEGIEQWVEGARLGQFEVFGRYDLQLRDPTVVIDIKLGGAHWRREELAGGTAYQLAIYARLAAGSGAPLPPVGYYIVRNQRLFTNAVSSFPQAEIVEGPPLDATWEGFERALEARCGELRAGTVIAGCEADDDHDPPAKDELVDGTLVLAPPCKYCEYKTICAGACA